MTQRAVPPVRPRRLTAVLCMFVALLAALLVGQAPPAHAATGALLSNDQGMYPRAIRLQNSGAANGRILASTVTFSGGAHGAVFESTDNGADFHQVGSVVDSVASTGLCCSTLFELPQQVGALPAGTLLWAASMGADVSNRRMSVRVWSSTDVGRTWSYLSTVAAAPNTGGLWEPEFSVDAYGELVCHYSDETDGVHSQKLVAARSTDGRTWSGWHNTVASNLSSDRPGMAVVRKLPNGTYYMVYEICAPSGQYACVVHYRTSGDGWNWGDPAYLGIRPQTPDGKYFKNTPNLAWAPQPGNPDGQLFLVGQNLYNANGTLASTTRREIWSNGNNGTGDWEEIIAPVAVADQSMSYCPNYSSALLPSTDSSTLLEVATDFDGGVCKAYFATRTTRPFRYWVDTFANAPVYASATSTAQTGTLYAGTDYVYCKVWGRMIGTSTSYNHWWLRTDPDVGPANQYVSAYYLSKWGNDEAKDNTGLVIADC